MIITKKASFIPYLIIVIIGAFIFIPFIGNVHLFDWDEANFAEAAREMLLSGNWLQVQIDYQPFWEKPPLFIWLQALSMAVFGVNEFAARFPNAVAGIISLCVLYYIGNKVSSKRFGWLWVMVYAGSWLPHFYFKSGIIDPVFNLFIFLSIYQIWNVIAQRKNVHALWSGIFLGLAVLTKGPAAILIVGLAVFCYWVVYKSWSKIAFKHLVIIGISTLFTVAIWFGIDIIKNGWWFTQTFLEYQFRLFSTQDAGHGGPFYYHFLVLLIGCFPAAAFLFQYTINKKKRLVELEDYDADFGKWMQLLFWVTLILFSIVKTKIVHYSSLCYLPLSYLAAREIDLIYSGKKSWKKGTKIILFVIGILLALVFIALPIVGMRIDQIIPMVKDVHAQANMRAQVSWAYSEVLYGVLFLIGMIVTGILMRKNKKAAILQLFLFQIIAIELVVAHFVPKVEPYSQGAAIAYFQSVDPATQVVYTGSYKSYAYLFYSGKLPVAEGQPLETIDNIRSGKVDKELFFVVRAIDKEKQWAIFPDLILLSEKNGFLFCKLPVTAP